MSDQDFIAGLKGYLNFLKESRFVLLDHPRMQQTLDKQAKDRDLRCIAGDIARCRACCLAEGRTRTVPGSGDPAARLVFVGEAPGFHEDQQGVPFVGRAGQLLETLLIGIGLKRSDVFICNVIKCRPPENRDPRPDEIEACEPFLLRQLEVIKPALICALGRHAAQTLLRTTEGINQMRGRFHLYHGIPLLPTLHPAAVLRNMNQRPDVEKDFALLGERLKST